MSATVKANNIVLDSLASNLKRLYVTSSNTNPVVNTAINTTLINTYSECYPLSNALVWGSASNSSVATTNSVDNSNPLMFANVQGIIGGLYISNNDTEATGTVVAMIDIDLKSNISGDWPYLSRGLQIDISEVV